jgi:Flp pilus assembly pilin Flp
VDPIAGLIAGSGWASGINLYGVVALLNIYGRLGLGDIEIPDVLMRTDVLVVALIMYALEFVADKIPYLDNVWDLIHTAIRPLGAAVLGLILVGDASGLAQTFAGVGSAGLALTSHTAKSTTRLAVNTSPEPVSNAVVSLAEDGLVAALIFFAVEYPLVAGIVVVVLIVAGALLMRALIGATRRGFKRLREAWSQFSRPISPS